jgi:uncharacterized protein
MKYAEPYIEYLVYFHGQRDYFECHEVLEEYWKETGMIKDHLWVGLIQVAVALYHHRRENFSGAERMLSSAIKNLKQNSPQLPNVALAEEKLFALLEERLRKIKNTKSYVSLDLPINDPKLLKLCQEKCLKNNLVFGSPSNMQDQFLVHKHKLRDRTEIIVERANNLKKKSKREDR